MRTATALWAKLRIARAAIAIPASHWTQLRRPTSVPKVSSPCPIVSWTDSLPLIQRLRNCRKHPILHKGHLCDRMPLHRRDDTHCSEPRVCTVNDSTDALDGSQYRFL